MTEQSISDLVARIIADGRLTKEEKREFDAFLLADGTLGVHEREQLDRLFSLIARGEVIVES